MRILNILVAALLVSLASAAPARSPPKDYAGPDGGSVFSVSNNFAGTSTPWTESGLNWNNAPALTGGALDAVQVGRQGEAAPAHLEEILLQRLLCVPHGWFDRCPSLSGSYPPLYRPLDGRSRALQTLHASPA